MEDGVPAVTLSLIGCFQNHSLTLVPHDPA